jgi:hypothetical protein
MSALRRRIPVPVKRAARRTAEAGGALTGPLRPLPDFVIIGAQKAGTTALYSYLLRHPSVTGPRSKEVEFFNRFFSRGEHWYRGHFPTLATRMYLQRRTGSPPRAGEASPDYLSNPWAARRAAGLVPDAKLIVLLRNPVERALSAHAHEVAAGRETLTFEEALASEEARLTGEFERMERDPGYYSYPWRYRSYAARGHYAEQLERWFAEFPREQVLVLGSEADLFRDPGGTYARVLDFLGLERYTLDAYPLVLSRDYPEMRAAVRAQLVARFRDPNARLFELLGRTFDWD